MPYVFSDPLRDHILKMFTEAEKITKIKSEKETLTKLIVRVKKMPKWRPGQIYQN